MFVAVKRARFKNLIEGLDSSGSYKQSKVLLIEDLISTGGSSIKAINAIREAMVLLIRS